jgi:phage gp29-like protein
MFKVPVETFPQLIALINETYTDEIDRLVDASVDDRDNIFCVAIDGTKRLAIKIDDSDIQIKLISSTAEFAAHENISPDLVDFYVAQLTDTDPFAPWLQQARNALAGSADLDEYVIKLETMFTELPSDKFNQVMSEAMTAASMGGYFESEDD